MTYLINYYDVILSLFLEHLWLSMSALTIALVIALPLAWFLFDHSRFAPVVMGTLGMLYTIPSIALIILLVPLFGLNKTSVFIALVIYCQVLLVRNILAGLQSIAPDIREAAIGLGMSRLQLAIQVELPLALPVILAGIRIAAVVAIAIATIGAKFGAGGLGVLLFDGISLYRMDKLWIGTIAITLLALGIYWGLQRIEAYAAARTRTT